MSKSEFKFTLGSKVRERITGYEGIITVCTEWLYGCRRYIIQAQGLVDGKVVKSRGTDEDALELISAAPLDHREFKYELGSKVKDVITLYEGIIIGRTHVLHRENVYDVQSQTLKDGVPVDAIGVPEQAIIVEVAAEPHKMRETGGPGDPSAGYAGCAPAGA